MDLRLLLLLGVLLVLIGAVAPTRRRSVPGTSGRVDPLRFAGGHPSPTRGTRPLLRQKGRPLDHLRGLPTPVIVPPGPGLRASGTAVAPPPPVIAPSTALAPDPLAPDPLAPDPLASESLASESLASESLASESLASESLAPDVPSTVGTPAEPLSVPEEERHARLHAATFGLIEMDPELSARRTLSGRQKRWLLATVVVTALGVVLFGHNAVIAVVAIAIVLYSATVLFRLRLFRLSAGLAAVPEISEAEAMSIPDDELPVYTVMIPAFGEPNVVAKLIDSVGKLRYPRHLLDMKLLLEEDDTQTVQAALSSPGVELFEVILVPAAQPRTKPKALNYGLQFARGELLTIYDAEDRPDPLQLRRAVYAMRNAPPETVCLQAELAYFNPTQNIITRWFTVEYLMWFTQFLPGLAYLDAPVPLGGTSNHFRTSVLREVGAWDPFNVTEDADLGVRLHRLGYRTGVLPSTTLEEANSDFVNWVRQRSRWYKGYLQAWLVHLRHPVTLYRELGWRGFLRFNLFVGGTPLLALLNPVFWVMTLVWFMGHPGFVLSIFPAPVYFAAVICWLFGTFMFVYLVLLCAYDAGSITLVLASVLTPVYWVMMAVAATKAMWQLVVSPSYWEKTAHGLTDIGESQAETPSSVGAPS